MSAENTPGKKDESDQDVPITPGQAATNSVNSIQGHRTDSPIVPGSHRLIWGLEDQQRELDEQADTDSG